MKASLIDRSNYYRGLLVLIGRDRIIDSREHDFMLTVGQMLDFDKRFCEAAIADLLDNRHITDEPILFEERTIAKCFLRDALRLALTDTEMHAQELSWLKTIARTNSLTDEWLEKERLRFQEYKSTGTQPDSFEIQPYL